MSYRDEIIRAKRLNGELDAKLAAVELIAATYKKMNRRGLKCGDVLQQWVVKMAELEEAAARLDGQCDVFRMKIQHLKIDYKEKKLAAMATFQSDVEEDNSKDVTRWIRVHEYKYRSRMAAVKGYVEIHGGDFRKLYYSDLAEDRKKGLIGDRLKVVATRKSDRRRKQS